MCFTFLVLNIEVQGQLQYGLSVISNIIRLILVMITFIERKKTCLKQDCIPSSLSTIFGKHVSRYTRMIFCTYSVYTIFLLQFLEEIF